MCSLLGDLGRSWIVHNLFTMLRCFRFALHQKDISGGSRSPEVSTPLHWAAAEQRPSGGGEPSP